MEEAPQQDSHNVPKKKRSSRKGLPRRFECQHEGCGRRYSRAEHLQRHALNHEPQCRYQCPKDGCQQVFVRKDLFSRHVERHEQAASVQPSTTTGASTDEHTTGTLTAPITSVSAPYRQAAQFSVHSEGFEQNLTGDTELATDWTNFPQPMDIVTLNATQDDNGFASWLLSPPGSYDWGLDMGYVPFMSPESAFGIHNVPQLTDPIFPAAEGINYDYLRQGNDLRIPLDDQSRSDKHVYVSTGRLDDILTQVHAFCGKTTKPLPTELDVKSLVYQTPEFMYAFWEGMSDQIPILHKATFSAEGCPILLLLAILPVGMAQLIRLHEPGHMLNCRKVADVIVTHLRWEIHTLDEAQPPIKLWVAQALLLLEFYEKMCSTRQLHERAHIYHTSTLTLLRRGSPLGGRPGAETPVAAPITAPGSPERIEERPLPVLEQDSWWQRWANNEAMLRVVFTAYEMDTLHATLFGHESNLLPSDVSLPLPCDEALWAAESPDQVSRLQTSLGMYGVRPTKFLDGLKRHLHGDQVQTHHYARGILLVGLLSAGCHLRSRDKQMQFLDASPSQEERRKWIAMLCRAFDEWKNGFENALQSVKPRRAIRINSGLTAEPALLYHSAYITMHIDILDCQVLTGSKVLLGRGIGRKERATAATRSKAWAETFEARIATLHAFKLLHATLVAPYNAREGASGEGNSLCNDVSNRYSSRSDRCIYRPWCLYIAALCIWQYHYVGPKSCEEIAEPSNDHETQRIAFEYLSDNAHLEDPEYISRNSSATNAVLDNLSSNLAVAEPEIFQEAAKRLQECRTLLTLHHSRIDPSGP